jgi:aryl-alcohol dehydrogenase-like predicted oxidoreductase
VRYIGASFHSRQAARAWLPSLDVLMTRYNLEHLGAEQDLFPYLCQDKACDPGIVVFNAAQGGCELASRFPADRPAPTIPDRYRFALSNPQVDLVLAGLRTRDEIDQALAALEQGPLDAETCACYRRYAARQACALPAS